MKHYTQRLENKYPELNELLALKDSFLRLVFKKRNIAKRQILNLENPMRCLLDVIQVKLRCHIVYGIFLWGIVDGFRHLLNPLGIPNYF